MSDERENLSWQRFGEASRELATVIAADGFEPDLILSIARGGLFLAGSLGYALAVKNLYVMNVEFYDGVGTTLDMPVMLPPVPSAVDFSAKKVLIADDVADTGRTIELVHTFIKDQVEHVRSAVIYEKPQSVIKCDYVWRRTDRWINFPWSSEDPLSSGPARSSTPDPGACPRFPAQPPGRPAARPEVPLASYAPLVTRPGGLAWSFRAVRLASGPWPYGTSRKTGLRTRRHHQHHGSYALGQLERNETPDPVRSDAVNPRFHCVRQQTDRHDQHELTEHTLLMILM
jgi:uncharacterized protein